MSYVEAGPNEYNVYFEADFIPASTIMFEMDGRTTEMDGTTTAGLTMVSDVPTLKILTYSPNEDDTYIYEVILVYPQ